MFLWLLRSVGLLEPQNLRVSDEWYTRFRVSWDPAPAPVLGYKLVYQPTGTEFLFIYLFILNSKSSWNSNWPCFHQCRLIVKYFVLPLDKDESLEVFVGDVTSYTLHNLLPGTTYDVQVFAQYDGGISKPLTGQGTTCTFSEVCLAGLVLMLLFQSQQDSQFECLSLQCTSMWPTWSHMTSAMTGFALNGRLTVRPHLTESSWILWTVSQA